MGARIEIIVNLDFMDFYIVAPLVGARIEIISTSNIIYITIVAPLVGARIEIPLSPQRLQHRQCRSPRGSED